MSRPPHPTWLDNLKKYFITGKKYLVAASNFFLRVKNNGNWAL
jgi:hypothetical protein